MMSRCPTRFLWMVVVLVTMTSSLYAQLGLSASIPDWASHRVVLSSYTGLELQTVDTLVADSEGHVSYPFPLTKGMYQLEGPSGKMELLSVECPIQFVMLDSKDLHSLQYLNSPVNERWNVYSIARMNYHHQIEDVKNCLRTTHPDSIQRLEAKQRYFDIQSTYHAFTDSLIRVADDYASTLIKVDRDLPLDINLSRQDQRKYLLEHFFDDVDFDELSLIPTNVLTTKIVDYLSLTQGLPDVPQEELAFIMGVDPILEKATVNIDMYAFVLEYLLKGFNALGLSQVTDYLLNFPYLDGTKVTEEQGMLLEQRVEPYQKIRVGVQAPDIQGITCDGQEYHLYSSSAPYIILVFWSTDCEYCHDFLNSIRKKLDLKHGFELVTFAIADDAAEVLTETRRMKLSGYHFYDEQRWNGTVFQSYHVYSTPTVFLLDRNKNIVCKPYDWGELNKYLRKYNIK